MNDKNMKRIVQNALKAVAKREGISVEGVRREIESAVAAARQKDDPDIQTLWESISAEGSGSLTAEDVIAYFAQIEIGRMD